MSTIEIDGLNEEDFRRSIENRLREGRAAAAIERLRPLLAPYAGPDGLLPERFLTIEPADLVLTGWDALHDAMRRRDMPGRRITAISIAFAWPEGDAQLPDEQGRIRPHIETSYYSDNAYPFSQSSREDLLEGYSFYGCAWAGDCEASDTTISVEGIDDLHGALAGLEARLLGAEEPDEEGVRAGSLGACLLSALFVQAVADRVTRDGLPRPICVMAGSNGVYPYFDVPVAGMAAVERKRAEEEEEAEVRVAVSRGVPTPRYSSLLMTGIPRAKKRAVLVLDPVDDVADRIAQLRHQGHHEGEAMPETHPADALPGDWAAAAADPAPDAMPIARADSPLLVKKPSKKSQSLHEILGLTEPETAAHADFAPLPGAPDNRSEPPRWDDWAEWDEPPASIPPLVPPAPEEPTRLVPGQAAEPGFALLEVEDQQWSHSLLVARPLPPIEDSEPPPAVVEALLPFPVADRTTEDECPRPSLRETLCAAPDDLPPPSLASRIAAWVGDRASALRTRLGW